MAGVEKDLRISVLLDFYGEMLTEKQREAVELYYNEDLSLAEIAEHSGITRQGVRDAVKRAENQLLEYEEKLGLWARFLEIKKGLEEIAAIAGELGGMSLQKDFIRKAQQIIEIAGKLGD
ncbi:MAG: putative DNA-binding protein [Oscillospiraceae bacterium]|nr:putative DNA-binding protein [Oscillospiraceae bacterium]